MKCVIKFNTKRSNEIKVEVEGKGDEVLARDANGTWRDQSGYWVANAAATAWDAVRCFITKQLPPNER
jgi:hypothetical protein